VVVIRYLAYQRADGVHVTEALDVDVAGEVALAHKRSGCTGLAFGSTAKKAFRRSHDALKLCRLCQGGCGSYEHAACPPAIAKLERQLRRSLGERGAA
jgi:hypothetical protein